MTDHYRLTITYALPPSLFPGVTDQSLRAQWLITGEVTTETLAKHLEAQVGAPFMQAQLKSIAKQIRLLPMDARTALGLSDTSVLKGVPWEIDGSTIRATVNYLDYPAGVTLERVEVVELMGVLN